MADEIDLIVKGRGSNISCDFREPINIPTEKYDARLGVKNFSTYNSIPNVEAGLNNKLKIKVPGSTEWEEFTLSTGAYELFIIGEKIIDWIEWHHPHLENVAEKFKLIGDDSTSKAEFVFKDDYGVDFDIECSMCELLGFSRYAKHEGSGIYPGDEIVNITKVTQLVFNCNVTSSNYINGCEMPFLYNCTINVPAGYRLSRELFNIAYKSLTTSQISHIRIWIVDQNGAPVNLRNEDLTVTLTLKIIPRVTEVSIADLPSLVSR